MTFDHEELEPKQPLVKPYFMTEDLALEELSPTVRKGFDEIVDRAYAELVVGEQNPLARLVGSTAVFETALSLVSQAELASAVFGDKVPLQDLHRLAFRA